MPESGSSRAYYAVMGCPVEHSKSPLIHDQFAKQFHIDIEYRAIEVAPGKFEQAVEEFRAAGGSGLNVTVPFKLEAYSLADRTSARAETAGAVNTLMFENGMLFGDNTDGIGLIRDVTINLRTVLRGRKILVLGAGGAVRGIVGPLLEQRPHSVIVANRTVSKAKELERMFASAGNIRGCGFGDLQQGRYHVVINGTAASLQGELPPLPDNLFDADALAYDLMYGDEPTAFMDWARGHGAARVADGLGMLVEQAAESFFIWHGMRPQTAPVLAALRKGA